MLRMGSRGADVTVLQQWLLDNGFDPGPLDGVFGPQTQTAVLAFQAAAGITADAVVGPNTRQAMTDYTAADTGTDGGTDGDTGTDTDSRTDSGTDSGTGDGSTIPTTDPTGPSDVTDPDTIPVSVPNTIRGLYGYLPAAVIDRFIDLYIEHNQNADVAVGFLRQDPIYDTYYPGNKRDDGSIRLTEIEYAATIDSYESTLAAAGINPDVFRDRFPDLIAGDKSALEFQTQVNTAQARVLSQEDELKQVWAEFYGLEQTTSSLLASVLDPAIGQAVLDRKITVAEIGAEALKSGFHLGRASANRLFQEEIGQKQAAELFESAAFSLPSLSGMVDRAGEGEFGLQDFLDAQALGDPEQRHRLRRAAQHEIASFGGSGGLRSQGGAITGLRQR